MHKGYDSHLSVCVCLLQRNLSCIHQKTRYHVFFMVFLRFLSCGFCWKPFVKTIAAICRSALLSLLSDELRIEQISFQQKAKY